MLHPEPLCFHPVRMAFKSVVWEIVLTSPYWGTYTCWALAGVWGAALRVSCLPGGLPACSHVLWEGDSAALEGCRWARLADSMNLTCLSELMLVILPFQSSFPWLFAPLKRFWNASCSFLGCRGVSPAKCSSSFLCPECLPSCLCLWGRKIKLWKEADNTLVWCIVFHIEWESKLANHLLHITRVRNR